MEITNYLNDLSNKLRLSSDDKIKIDNSIVQLKKKLWGYFQERLLEITIIGSYDRDTIIKSDHSDVDILVIFKQKEFQPQTYLSQIKKFCESNYPRSEVYPDHPTIVIELEHIKFEIIPSYKFSDQSVKIPAPTTKELKWITSSPVEFKSQLIAKDSRNKTLIIPVVRIFKYWNYLNNEVFKSYEIEKAIVNKSYNSITFKDYFFSIIDLLREMAITEEQKNKVSILKDKKRRLYILETNKIHEYINEELSSFLPFP